MRVINTVTDIYAMLAQISSYTVIAVDIETTGLDPYSSNLSLVSFAVDDESYVVDFTRIPTHAVHLFSPLFRDPNVRKVIHNAVFDVKYLTHVTGVTFENIHCTLIAEQVLKSGLLVSGFGLDDVAERRLGIKLDKTIRQGFIDRDPILPFTEDELLYSASDAEVLLPIYRQQLAELTQENQLRLFYEIEMPLVPVTAKMEYDGVCVDREKMLSALPAIDHVSARADRILQRAFISEGIADFILFDRSGYRAVNTASPKQMLDAFHRIGINVDSLNRKDLTSWDGEWAIKNAKRASAVQFDLHDDESEDGFKVGYAHPVLRWHAIRTQAAKLSGTYITGLLNTISPVTGRIHPGFKQCGAVSTGRFSSNRPNFQNLPNLDRMRELGLEEYNVRSMFVAAPGRKFIVADYSGIELVILAAMSGDANLMARILEGDIHSYVANALFGEIIQRRFGSLITKENRDQKGSPWHTIRNEFKRVSYGISYGSTGYNLYRTCGIAFSRLGIALTQDECDRWVNDWKNTLFPATGVLLDRNATYAITRGYTESVAGRRRRWDVARIRQEKWLMLAAMREGMNQPIQSSSADMTKLAMLRVSRTLDLRFARIVACIHDELLIEADDAYVEEAASITKIGMEGAGYELFPNLPPNAIVAAPKVSLRYDK